MFCNLTELRFLCHSDGNNSITFLTIEISYGYYVWTMGLKESRLPPHDLKKFPSMEESKFSAVFSSIKVKQVSTAGPRLNRCLLQGLGLTEIISGSKCSRCLV